MLKDRYFYPLAIALIAAMIWYALSKGRDTVHATQKILENGYVLEKENLPKLTASTGTFYNYVSQTEKEDAYVILNSNISRNQAPDSAGVFTWIGPEFENAFAERNLRLTIRARQGRKNPLNTFDMGYFSAEVKESGWQEKTLKSEWQDFVIDVTPKAPLNALKGNYFGVWPGEGNRKTMEIQSMRIDVIQKREH